MVGHCQRDDERLLQCMDVEKLDSEVPMPSGSEVYEELKLLSRISYPMILTGILVYVRSLISMLFLGRLGEAALAAGSLSIGFANITGYSIIFGLATGMEPICGQAYGAQNWSILGPALIRTIVFLIISSLPISLLWLHMDHILLLLGQEATIIHMAKTYILFSLPDLFAQALLHPLRIYLRSQNITFPIAICSGIATLFHLPINLLLVQTLDLGIKGVALGVVFTNFNLVFLLLIYIYYSGVYQMSWKGFSQECLHEWKSFLTLAIPSCVSICLEWWWYEFMIILCGLLLNPEAKVAAMGVLIQFTSLIYVFPSSLSMGVSTRVANELGAREPAKAKRAAMVGSGLAIVMGLGALSFATLLRNYWGMMFTKDYDILRLTKIALPILGLCELGNCPQTTMCGVLRGSARPNIGANVNLGAFYFIGMPVALVLAFKVKIGFSGLWLGLLVAQISCAVTLGVVVIRTNWVVQAQRAEELTKFDGYQKLSERGEVGS
ncbi:hypothetical protein AMTR_s00068p00197570 [Amborella trichopoda]|uniref:Protein DETOXIFICATION n=2 Tax=Amborella trichopoda TaxID=13333 RepID=U5DDD2_AMBTC|nr:hypothetical protein AMTR_s00068p00197570 [Amborella trichopoda]